MASQRAEYRLRLAAPAPHVSRRATAPRGFSASAPEEGLPGTAERDRGVRGGARGKGLCPDIAQTGWARFPRACLGRAAAAAWPPARADARRWFPSAVRGAPSSPSLGQLLLCEQFLGTRVFPTADS